MIEMCIIYNNLKEKCRPKRVESLNLIDKINYIKIRFGKNVTVVYEKDSITIR